MKQNYITYSAWKLSHKMHVHSNILTQIFSSLNKVLKISLLHSFFSRKSKSDRSRHFTLRRLYCNQYIMLPKQRYMQSLVITRILWTELSDIPELSWQPYTSSELSPQVSALSHTSLWSIHRLLLHRNLPLHGLAADTKTSLFWHVIHNILQHFPSHSG